MLKLTKSTLGSTSSIFFALKHSNKTNGSCFNILKRTFLSDEYYCYEDWDKYLMSDIMKKTGEITQFSSELSKKLTDKSLISPLDMDLLASKLVYINNHLELEFNENLFESFRKTQSTLYSKPSMHYGLIRSYIDLDQADRILEILKLKYKYGIFVDSYTSNMLMDTYIKKKDYVKAALVAHEVLLQENSENQLTLTACLFSCMNFLTGLKKNQIEIVLKEEEETPETKKKILVRYLRKPYNDEHFDLKDPILLSGKTIYFAGANHTSIDLNLANSLKAYGLLIFRKYEKAIDVLENALIKEKSNIFSFVIDEFQEVEKSLIKDEAIAKDNVKFLEKWKNLKQYCEANSNKQIINKDTNVLKEIENLLDNVKKIQVPLDMEAQKSLFSKWIDEQNKDLDEQIRKFTIEQKKADILNRLNQLERQEEILTFFDRKQEIENSYFSRGFPREFPSLIPIEKEEEEFKKKFEKHFKPYPKYMNRDPLTQRVSDSKKYQLESLRKIYLNNKKAQTTVDTKLVTKKKKV